MDLLSLISSYAAVQLAIVVGLVVIVVMLMILLSIAHGRRQELAKSQQGFNQNMELKRFERIMTALPPPPPLDR